MSKSDFTRKYAIVGYGETKVGHLPEYSGRTLQTEAARLAIEDAGLRREDIDGAVNAKGEGGGGGTGNWTDGFPRVLGLPVKFYYHVGRGGAQASYGLHTALSYLDAGVANYVCVAGARADWQKSHVPARMKSEPGRSGIWGKELGDAAAYTHHSLFATRHMHEYGTTSPQLGAIAVAERAWACLNPAAYMHGRPITVEDHQNSPIVCWPYHIMDICLQSDGGAAFIVTTAERAKDCKKPPAYLLGIGTGEHIDHLWWEKGHYTALPVDTAKEAAFGQAGIGVDDVDVFEFYDCFTMEVLLQCEGYGFCKKGEGGPFVATGALGPGGSRPTNTGGGLLASHHIGDFTPMIEAVRQIRGEGGARQVKDAKIAIATGHGGELLYPGMCSTHTCTILGK